MKTIKQLFELIFPPAAVSRQHAKKRSQTHLLAAHLLNKHPSMILTMCINHDWPQMNFIMCKLHICIYSESLFHHEKKQQMNLLKTDSSVTKQLLNSQDEHKGAPFSCLMRVLFLLRWYLRRRLQKPGRGFWVGGQKHNKLKKEKHFWIKGNVKELIIF